MTRLAVVCAAVPAAALVVTGCDRRRNRCGPDPAAAGGPALKLVEALLSPAELAKFSEARPYVRKIRYDAVGAEAKGDVTTAKVILGLQK